MDESWHFWGELLEPRFQLLEQALRVERFQDTKERLANRYQEQYVRLPIRQDQLLSPVRVYGAVHFQVLVLPAKKEQHRSAHSALQDRR